MTQDKQLTSLFGAITQEEASFKVRAMATHYPQFVRVYIPRNPFSKLLPFMEAAQVKPQTSAKSKVDEDDLTRSLRRTKRLLSDIVLCNPFSLFATFTFSPEKTADRADPDRVKTQMGYWLKNQRSRHGKFAYLLVPEFHADRKSLHFHALFQDYKGVLVDSGKTIRNRKAYNFQSYTLGFNSAVPIDDVEKVSSYVKKYITKDMPVFRGAHRFWASHGLKRPRIEYNPDDSYLHRTPDWSNENEYGTTLIYLNSNNHAQSEPQHPDNGTGLNEVNGLSDESAHKL